MAFHITTLLPTIKSLLAMTEVENALPVVLDLVSEYTGAERGCLELYDETGGIAFKRARQHGQDLDDEELSRISKNVVALARLTQEVIVSENAMTDPRFDDPERSKQTILNQKLLSFACAPLCEGEKVFGVVYLDHRQEEAKFNQETRQLLHELTELLAGPLRQSLDNTLAQRRERERRQRHMQHVSDELARIKGYRDMVGTSPAMQQVYQFIEVMKDYDEYNVLILGEPGTGKELVAAALHRASRRSKKEMIAFDCCTVAESLLASELFGHEKGAFSGADQKREGLINAAEGGTLFLDEIGNLTLDVQKKLLRFLEEKQYRRMGSNTVYRADVRLIFATNKDLKKLVTEEKFMPDLLDRLERGRTLTLPPLRERGRDVLLIAEKFLQTFNERHRTQIRFAPEARDWLLRYHFPGNIRELDKIVDNAAFGLLISPDDDQVMQPHHLSRLAVAHSSRPDGFTAAEDSFYAQFLPEAYRSRNFIAGRHSSEDKNAKYDWHDQLHVAVAQALNIPFRQAKDALIKAFEYNFIIALLREAKGVEKNAIARAEVDPKTLIEKMKSFGIKREWFVE
ncbi:sigma 54-interacting transcriptional regulator [bacterium]|nr:sigma 54-interacting transcriptional regulator [bacterium]